MSETTSNRGNRPDKSIDPKALGKMNAHDRVVAAYKIVQQRNQGRPASASFRSHTLRSPIGCSLPDEYKSSHQRRKEQLDLDKVEKTRAVLHLDEGEHSLKEYVQRARETDKPAAGAAQRVSPSAWSRDKVARGEYMYNWRSFPEGHRSARTPQTPGPGAYTSDLFFVGF